MESNLLRDPVRRLDRRRALSLIEALIALSILGTLSILYAATSNTQVAHSAVNTEFEFATMLLLRQVERIRAQDLRGPQGAGPGQAPYNEPDFRRPRCPPYAYTNTGGTDLDPPVSSATILTSANSFLIPAGHPWLVDLDDSSFDSSLGDQGYSITVRCMRVQESTNPNVMMEDSLVKFAVRIDQDRDLDGVPDVNLITAEFFQEVR